MKIRVRVFADGFRGYEVVSCKPEEFYQYQLELLHMEPTSPPSIAVHPRADIYPDYTVGEPSIDAIKKAINHRCAAGIHRLHLIIRGSIELRRGIQEWCDVVPDFQPCGSLYLTMLQRIEEQFRAELTELETMIEAEGEKEGAMEDQLDSQGGMK